MKALLYANTQVGDYTCQLPEILLKLRDCSNSFPTAFPC